MKWLVPEETTSASLANLQRANPPQIFEEYFIPEHGKIERVWPLYSHQVPAHDIHACQVDPANMIYTHTYR